jgi:Protein of unknown function (DUF3667)
LLFSRPGRLTVDYFAERRARYLPPVRLYLVLSLLFFSFGVHLGGEADLAKVPVPSVTAAEVSGGDDGSQWCEALQVSGSVRLQNALRRACHRARADHGVDFGRTLVHNIPKMMFVFLPLMAVFMKIIYFRPNRYYVEHLVYLLHNHSAIFLSFLLLVVVDRLSMVWQSVASLVPAGTFIVVIYALWYPYASMRRYYRQGRFMTGAKYVIVAVVYLLCLLLTLSAAAILTALES